MEAKVAKLWKVKKAEEPRKFVEKLRKQKKNLAGKPWTCEKNFDKEKFSALGLVTTEYNMDLPWGSMKIEMQTWRSAASCGLSLKMNVLVLTGLKSLHKIVCRKRPVASYRNGRRVKKTFCGMDAHWEVLGT